MKGFKDILRRVRNVLLCCGGNETKHVLQIGSPTDVKRLDPCMPGLSAEQQALIREKAAHDATTMFPTTTTNSTLSTPHLTLSPTTPASTSTTSLPIPAPPPHRHPSNASLPAHHHARMKTLWDHTRRLSQSVALPMQLPMLGFGSGAGWKEGEGSESTAMLRLDVLDLGTEVGEETSFFKAGGFESCDGAVDVFGKLEDGQANGKGLDPESGSECDQDVDGDCKALETEGLMKAERDLQRTISGAVGGEEDRFELPAQ